MKLHKKISKEDIRPLPYLSANSLGWESCPSPINAPATPPISSYFSSPATSSSPTISPAPPIPERSNRRRPRPPPLTLASSNFPANMNATLKDEHKSPDNLGLASSPFATIFEHEEAQYQPNQQPESTADIGQVSMVDGSIRHPIFSASLSRRVHSEEFLDPADDIIAIVYHGKRNGNGYRPKQKRHRQHRKNHRHHGKSYHHIPNHRRHQMGHRLESMGRIYVDMSSLAPDGYPWVIPIPRPTKVEQSTEIERPPKVDERTHSDCIEDIESMAFPEEMFSETTPEFSWKHKCMQVISCQSESMENLHSSLAVTRFSDCSSSIIKTSPKLRSSKSLSWLDTLRGSMCTSSCSSNVSPISQSPPDLKFPSASRQRSGAWAITRKPVASAASSMRLFTTDSQSSVASSTSQLYKLSSSGSASATVFTAPTSSYGSEKIAQSPIEPLFAYNLTKARGEKDRKSDPGYFQRSTPRKPGNALTRCIDKVVGKFATIATSKSANAERKGFFHPMNDQDCDYGEKCKGKFKR